MPPTPGFQSRKWALLCAWNHEMPLDLEKILKMALPNPFSQVGSQAWGRGHWASGCGG